MSEYIIDLSEHEELDKRIANDEPFLLFSRELLRVNGSYALVGDFKIDWDTRQVIFWKQVHPGNLVWFVSTTKGDIIEFEVKDSAALDGRFDPELLAGRGAWVGVSKWKLKGTWNYRKSGLHPISTTQSTD